MIELTKDIYSKVLPLLKSLKTDHTFSYAVLQNKLAGKVFVDDVMNPKTALIQVHNGIHHLIGNSENEKFNLECEQILAKQSRPYVLFVDDQWESHVNQWSINWKKEKRTVFDFDEKLFKEKEQVNLPKEYTIKPIDKKIIQNSELYPESFYKLYWQSVEQFLTNGFGFCIVNENDEIISEVITAAISDSIYDIDIHTKESYRRKGLTKSLIQTCINYGLTKNLIPRWECLSSNQASVYTAKSLGFVIDCYHPFYIYSPNIENKE